MVTGPTRDEVIGKIVAALLGLVFVAALAFLPPFENDQLADAETSLRSPLAAVIVAFVVAAVPLWRYRVGIALVITVFIAAVTQGSYLYVTTRSGANLTKESLTWPQVAHSGAPSGQAGSNANSNGAGSAEWDGSHVILRLQSRHVGTQRFFSYNAGEVRGSYSAQVLLRKTAGSLSGDCILAFGYISIDNFYVFRVKHSDKSYGGQARVVHVFANGTQQVEAESRNLPYVNRFSLPRTWEQDQTKLSMLVEGHHYTFYVDDRSVFSETCPRYRTTC